MLIDYTHTVMIWASCLHGGLSLNTCILWYNKVISHHHNANLSFDISTKAVAKWLMHLYEWAETVSHWFLAHVILHKKQSLILILILIYSCTEQLIRASFNLINWTFILCAAFSYCFKGYIPILKNNSISNRGCLILIIFKPTMPI